MSPAAVPTVDPAPRDDVTDRPPAPAPATQPTFDDVTALDPVGDGTSTARLDPTWTIGGRPNGGYLTAILGRAAAAATPHPHVLAASAQFLRSPDPGAVLVSVDVLRSGRNAAQARARMAQEGEVCVEALFTLGRLAPTTPFWDGGVPEPAFPADDRSVPLVGPTSSGIDVALLSQVDLRLDPDSLGFAAGRPSGRGELRGWLGLPGGQTFDPGSLLFAVDAFPPATFDVASSGWVPTFELTVYVRALPAPGPVRILHQARLIDGGRVDEACFVWDRDHRLVAQSTQLAGIRLG